ncbi:MAG: autotransporter-associated beta strand repeat-containing protein, partial [Burkholderiales bacterium]|nr:autotransporter-associated beta strand repeat-containing protein [Burkholderiales bacterium]
NGQVFVLNPNGVLFGPGAQVDVGGIVASTLGLSDADFLAGRYTFANGGGAGSVVNRGTIRAADGGYVALLAPQVTNEGAIAARLGTVALGAGDQVTLTLAGNSLVGFAVDQAAVAALIANRQLIQADGGAVVLSARAKDALLATVVNNEGIVEARSVSVRNGVIRLEGGASGVVAVRGRLDATGANAGETGGSVTITGDKVALANGALVDASGHAGGGTVLVGGDYQGRNPEVRNASRSYVGPDAVVRADATHNGEGGRVIVWADGATQFYGAISARGGPGGGNGGFVETSGKVTLQSSGSVDASAANGRAGQWLLDPNNITIQTAGANTNVTAGPNFTTTNDSAIVTTGSILAALNAGTSVTVTTGSAGANTQPGNITVANAIAKNAGGNAALTLTAINNIVFNAGANVSSTSNQLNLTLNAGGTITSPVAINTNGGLLTYNAAGAATQSGVISGAGSVVKNGAGTLTLSGANSYSGATSINAGALQLGAANRIANTSAVTVASGATFNLNNFAETVGSIAGAGTIALGTGTLTAGGNNTSTTFSGAATGSGGLTKTGTGTLTLSGANAYTGATAVNAGVLRVQSNTALGTVAGATTVASGAVLEVDGSGLAIAEPLTLTGTGVGGAGALRNLANANTLTGAITLGAGGARINSNGGTLTISGAGNITGATRPLRVGGAGNTTISKAIATTSGTFTKDGAGTLTLSGANAYTGATAVNAGVLRVQSNTALGTVAGTTTVASGAALELSGSGLAIAELLTLTGTGVGGAGALRNLANANTLTGAITLGAGGARINSDSGTLTISGAGDITGATRPLRVGGAGNTTISKAIATTSGTLTKDGAGTLTLSGANAYTGATAVNAGVLRVQSNTALGTVAGTTTVAAGAALELSGSGLAIAEPLTLNGTGVGGSGALRNLASANTMTGAIALGATGARINSDAGTLTISGAGNITGNTRPLTVGGAGNTTISKIIATTSGTLTKNGTGTLTLSGANTYTGATNVNAGTLIATSANALGTTANGTTVNAGATLELDGTLTYAEPVALNNATLAWAVGNPTLNGAVALTGGNTITGAAGTFALGGVVSGAGGFDKAGAGTLVVSGNNTYTGLTQVSAGVLQVSSSNGLGTTAGATHVGGNARLIVNGVAIGAEPVILDGPGLFGAGAITSNGVASLAGPITLAADSVIAPNAGSALSLTGPVDGAFGLTTGGLGSLGLNGTVGGTAPLAFLTTGATGTTQINAGLVRTSGSQSYNNPAAIGAGVTLQSTGADLAAAAPVTATAGVLALSAAGNVSFANAANDFGTAGIAAGGDATLVDANGIVLAASTVGGNLDLTASGAIAQTGAISVAGTSDLSAGPGPIALTGANDFGGDVALTTAGAAQVNDVNALALGAASVGTLTATAGGGVTLNGTVTATGAGSSIVLAAPTFINNAGAAALDPGAGRWLVYSTDPATNAFGGLASGNQALWNRAYPAVVTEPGNRYVFAIQPTLAFTSTDVAKTYGQDATAFVASALAVTGFVDAAIYGGVFTQDTAANTYSGAPVVTSPGSPATAPAAGSPYAIAVDVSGITPTTGYGKAAFSTGVLTVNAASLTITADNQSKVYGDADPTLTATYTGLQNGETPAVVTGLSLFAPTGAAATVSGSPHAIVPSGASAVNYTISYVDGLLTVTPRPVTIAADPQTKVYGQPDPALTYAVGGGGLVYGDVLTGALTRVSGETVAAGPYAILQGTLTNAANPNYDIAYTGNVLAITPATLTYLANAATILQGAPFPPFTGTVLGFQWTDTQANATTGTLAFATTAASNSPAGTYPIDGFGLVANFGNYVFAQAPSNATALTIEPRGNSVPPVELPQAYTGALATAAQSESTCAELQADGQIETLCGAQQNFRSSEQVNLVPGWRRVIELGRAALTVEGEGMRTP